MPTLHSNCNLNNHIKIANEKISIIFRDDSKYIAWRYSIFCSTEARWYRFLYSGYQLVDGKAKQLTNSGRFGGYDVLDNAIVFRTHVQATLCGI